MSVHEKSGCQVTIGKKYIETKKNKGEKRIKMYEKIGVVKFKLLA